mmetsp:Transcript_54186/g.162234  ORF Transcript_54186/g.162234 Transcript_54186/m.162234 type:complete len:241 (+) Transcript_54186:1337-2059(+)
MVLWLAALSDDTTARLTFPASSSSRMVLSGSSVVGLELSSSRTPPAPSPSDVSSRAGGPSVLRRFLPLDAKDSSSSLGAALRSFPSGASSSVSQGSFLFFSDEALGTLPSSTSVSSLSLTSALSAHSSFAASLEPGLPADVSTSLSLLPCSSVSSILSALSPTSPSPAGEPVLEPLPPSNSVMARAAIMAIRPPLLLPFLPLSLSLDPPPSCWTSASSCMPLSSALLAPRSLAISEAPSA